MASPFHSWLNNLPLAQEKWFVLRHQGRWKVRRNELFHGPYDLQAEAMRAAVDEAHKAGRKGTGAQVFLQVQDEQFRLEWTYGLDPYPPQKSLV